MFEPINLDGLSTNPADLAEAANTLALLANYAWNKAWAMEYREKGDILSAQGCEKECECWYGELPEWAKW